jgi:hypothetical protein
MRRCSGLRSHVVPESVAPVRAFREPLLHQKGSSYSVVVGLKEALGILLSWLNRPLERGQDVSFFLRRNQWRNSTNIRLHRPAGAHFVSYKRGADLSCVSITRERLATACATSVLGAQVFQGYNAEASRLG